MKKSKPFKRKNKTYMEWMAYIQSRYYTTAEFADFQKLKPKQ